MKQLIKSILLFPQATIAKIFFHLESALSVFFSKGFSLEGRERVIAIIENDKREVHHKKLNKDSVSFSLYTPNRICYFRQKSFSSKEPETLEWIDRYGGKGVLYDIGSNIGIYSIYYAITQPGKVYSFEPSVFNLRQLGKNISYNNLSKKITIVPNPLSEKTGKELFINSNMNEGGALSAFGVTYGHDGKNIKKEVGYSVLGFSLDDLLEHNIIPESPSLIKIDVDGIEHLILSGAQNTLRNEKCKSILVEVNDKFKEQSTLVNKILTDAGFNLRNKLHSNWFDGSVEFGETYNQIWVKE